MRLPWRPKSGWRIVGWCAALVCALPSIIAQGQQIDARLYESEDDLWEALREGEISYDDYLELLERHQSGTDSALVPVSDWEGLPGSGAGYLVAPEKLQTVTEAALETPGTSRSRRIPILDDLRWSWKSGINGALSSPAGQEGFTSLRAVSGRWQALLHYRQDGRGGKWQRRVIAYDAPSVTLQAGTFEPRWGRGLVVGRRSRLVGRTGDDPSPGSFWQPSLARFNGVRARSEESRLVAVDAFYSRIQSDLFEERAGAAMLTFGRPAWRVGFARLHGEVERRDSAAAREFDAAGWHLRIGQGERTVLAEIAYDEGRATAKAGEAVWRLEHGRVHVRAWLYSPDYVNPWGGGPGHSDETTIDLPEIGDSWSSRTTGERGFSLSTRIDPAGSFRGGRLRAGWEWMTHREFPEEPLRHDWLARLEWRRTRAWIRPFARGTTVEGEPSRHSLGLYADAGDRDRGVSIRTEFGRHRADADRFARAGFGGRWRLSELVRLAPTVRWVDPDLSTGGDGYWYLYCTEIILPARWWQMEARLVWQRFEDRGRGDVVEVRVRVNVSQ
ncbi:MAG: hypothetical protein AB1752_08330 [Candidatus Zixiibacteriota bacterium]